VYSNYDFENNTVTKTRKHFRKFWDPTSESGIWILHFGYF